MYSVSVSLYLSCELIFVLRACLDMVGEEWWRAGDWALVPFACRAEYVPTSTSPRSPSEAVCGVSATAMENQAPALRHLYSVARSHAPQPQGAAFYKKICIHTSIGAKLEMNVRKPEKQATLFPFRFTRQHPSQLLPTHSLHGQIMCTKHDGNSNCVGYSSETSSRLLFISCFLSAPHYLHTQIVQNALHRDMRLADLHTDGGDLRELDQRGHRDRVSHRLQEVVRRALDDILSDPAEDTWFPFRRCCGNK